jgi:putative transposase
MLTEAQLAAYYATHKVAKAAVKIIDRARKSPPLAPPSDGFGARIGRYISAKMGHSVSTDAKHTEFDACLDYDLDGETYEYWEQAVVLNVPQVDADGRRRGHARRIDFLVLNRRGLFLDSWKEEEELLGLVEREPGMYRRDDDGAFRSPPHEEVAAKLGMTFRLRTPASRRPEIILNGNFLRDYYRSTRSIDHAARLAIRDAVESSPGVTIAQLLADVPEASADDVYLLIARREIYVNLARHRLADVFFTPVFPSEAYAFAITGVIGSSGLVDVTGHPLLRVGAGVELAGRVATVVGASDVSLRFRVEGGEVLEMSRPDAEERVRFGGIAPAGTHERARDALKRLRGANVAAETERHRRVAILRSGWAGLDVPVSSRTFRRWGKRFREEVIASGVGSIALTPATIGRPRRPANLEREDLITQCITELLEVKDPPTRLLVSEEIKKRCVAKGFDAPSYSTVCDRIKNRDRYELVLAQQGSKAAYQIADEFMYLEWETPRHGQRPWERAHLDHTQIDLELVDSETGLPLGRPWLTLLIDAYSRRILAYYLTFDEPSAKSAVMCLRRCVQRWGRLPDLLVVDDGIEFHSNWFETFLTDTNVNKIHRRADPRAGAILERFFGSLNTQLWHRLRGQTRPTKNVRSMSPEVEPELRAVWTLPAITRELEWFLFECYDTAVHPASGASPAEVYTSTLALMGQRDDVRRIVYDEAFFFLTLPTTAKGTATVRYDAGGVKINERYYRCPEMRLVRIDGQEVPVRYDPADARHAWAFILGAWRECWCKAIRALPPVSEAEIAAVAAEYDQRRRLTRAGKPKTARALLEHHVAMKARETSLLKGRRAAANRAAGNDNHPPAADATTTEPEEILIDPELAPDPDEPDLFDPLPNAPTPPASAPKPKRAPRRRRTTPPAEDLQIFGTY